MGALIFNSFLCRSGRQEDSGAMMCLEFTTGMVYGRQVVCTRSLRPILSVRETGIITDMSW